MRLLVLGDTHGNTLSAKRAILAARANGASHIVQCGDFGLWTHRLDGIMYLDDLNEAARDANVIFVWLDGNHEDFDALEGFIAASPRNDKGHFYIRSNILYSPRGNAWTWAGKRFMTVGGAVSVDKGIRLDAERPFKGVLSKKLWWPQESIKDGELNAILNIIRIDKARDKQPNYLFSHDCSDQTPFWGRMKPDLDSKANRQKMDKILNAAAPDWHFHGHMHNKYVWERPVVQDGVMTDKWIKVRGLECNGMTWHYGILDTEADTFNFIHAFTGSVYPIGEEE